MKWLAAAIVVVAVVIVIAAYVVRDHDDCRQPPRPGSIYPYSVPC